tara:strand:- start:5982 stop:6245 length:264 start_codon:yes stop_codon:yes gene_type:complete
MKTNDIKKGMKIKSVQLGAPVTGVMMDNMKGDTRLVYTHGEEVGMFNETGSVYSHDIIMAEIAGKWVNIKHTEKQLKLKALVEKTIK